MYVVVIAWLYVALMMAVAEATSTTGSLLGAGITFLLYGALPLGLVVYVMGAPARGRAIKAREQSDWAAGQPITSQPSTEAPATTEPSAVNAMTKPASAAEFSSATACAIEPDAGGKAPADTVAPVRKEA